MSFASDLERFRKKATTRTETLIRATVLNVMSNIIRRTPVDTGYLRANWQANLNAIPSSSYVFEGKKKPIAQTVESAADAVGNMGIGDTVFFVNDAPYAVAIEMGHSRKQAPVGMMRISVMEAGGE